MFTCCVVKFLFSEKNNFFKELKAATDYLRMEFKNNIIRRPDTNDFEDEPSLGHLIIKNLTNAADKTVMIHGITGEELKAMELVTRSIEISKGLKVAGIKPGDIISIVIENRFEFAYILFGTIFLNCISAPLNPTYTEDELNHAFNLSKPKVVFASHTTIQKVKNVVKSLSYVKLLILIDDGPSRENEGITRLRCFISPKLLNGVHFQPQPVNKLKSVCLIVCSSGTTGRPKGVQLTQANMIVSIRHVLWSIREHFNYELVILGFRPMFHLYGDVLISMMGLTPGRIILLPKFEEKTFFSTIEKYRCTFLPLAPSLMVFLSKNPNANINDLSSVRRIHSGGAPLSKDTEDAVINLLQNPNVIITQGYGMSELTGGVLSRKNICKPGSVGDLNLGVSVKVIDENGKTLGPNQRGELCFKGSRVMAGYIGNEMATSAMIDQEGWLHTGDVGYYDEDLQFFIVDRIKELIKWKAFQVPPAEIEALLLTHPKIKDCGVIGKPDEASGELPMAFVVRLDASLSEDDVISYANKDASPEKKLRGGVIFIDEIPKNSSGKILRHLLRELVKQQELKSKP